MSMIFWLFSIFIFILNSNTVYLILIFYYTTEFLYISTKKRRTQNTFCPPLLLIFNCQDNILIIVPEAFPEQVKSTHIFCIRLVSYFH